MEWCRRPIRLDFFDLFISRPYFADLDMGYMLNWFLLCGPIAKRSTSCCIPDFLLVEKTSCILHLLFFVEQKKEKGDQALVPKLNTCLDAMFVTPYFIVAFVHPPGNDLDSTFGHPSFRARLDKFACSASFCRCQICLAWRSDRYPRRMSYLCHTAPVFFLSCWNSAR
jgi:hypothetical protein